MRLESALGTTSETLRLITGVSNHVTNEWSSILPRDARDNHMPIRKLFTISRRTVRQSM